MSILINAKQNAFFLSYNVCALILSANIVILLLYYSYFSLFSLQGQFSEVQTKEFPGLAGIIGIY